MDDIGKDDFDIDEYLKKIDQSKDLTALIGNTGSGYEIDNIDKMLLELGIESSDLSSGQKLIKQTIPNLDDLLSDTSKFLLELNDPKPPKTTFNIMVDTVDRDIEDASRPIGEDTEAHHAKKDSLSLKSPDARDRLQSSASNNEKASSKDAYN